VWSSRVQVSGFGLSSFGLCSFEFRDFGVSGLRGFGVSGLRVPGLNYLEALYSVEQPRSGFGVRAQQFRA
jgi:hypothetical protein